MIITTLHGKTFNVFGSGSRRYIIKHNTQFALLKQKQGKECKFSTWQATRSPGGKIGNPQNRRPTNKVIQP